MTDWKEKTLGHWELINRLASRRFGSCSLAEEAALFVMDGLADKDWQRVRSFGGKSSFATFLSSLSWRLLEDFSRKRFGRVRPPLWLTKLGGIWLTLFRFLCLERATVPDAVEFTMERSAGHDKKEIEESAWILLERVPDCGSHQAREIAYEEEQGSATSGRQPEQLVEKEERENFIQALFHGLTDPEHNEALAGSCAGLFDKGLQLTAEERLLLRLCFQDGLPVTRAGEMLGLNRHQVHGRLRRLLARLRREFEKAGLDRELRLLMDGEE